MIKIYKCNICGNIITKIHDSNVNVVCCNEEMQELIINNENSEEHLLKINLLNHLTNIKIGNINHPMNIDHYIQWVLIETNNGIQLKYLKPFEVPEVDFTLIDDKILAVYTYCNKHGLFKKEIN